MKKIAASALLALSFAFASVNAQPVSSVSGTFRGFRDKCIAIETDVEHCIPSKGKVTVVGALGGLYPKSWVFPGDGVVAYSGTHGKIIKLEIFTRWFFGPIAFAFSNRLTLADGSQFLLGSAPVFLNGQKISDASFLKEKMPAVVRFNSLQNRVVGIWAFDFQSLSNPDARNSFQFEHVGKKNVLKIAKQFEKAAVSVMLAGVTHPIPLHETKPGLFVGLIPFPEKIELPGSYLIFNPGSKEESINQKPVTRYTAPPWITEVEPPPDTASPLNPPYIFVSFDEHRSPIDPNSVRFSVDGREVTSRCFTTASLIFFKPPTLVPGKHTCAFSVETPGGGASIHYSWTFEISP